MKIINQGFDHVEYVVRDLAHHERLWTSLGFERLSERDLTATRGTRSVLFAQGFVRILVTAVTDETRAQKGECGKYLKKHSDGVCVLALEVDDTRRTFDEVVGRGARVALEPVTYESEHGQVVRAEVWTPADLRYALIERKVAKSDPSGAACFDEGLDVPRLESPSPLNIRVIDHLTNNVGIGELDEWVEWYKKVFDFTTTRHFEISTGRTGLNSDVVESKCGKIKVPVNEATEPESQVQEFVERYQGPGVQHLALLTTDIVSTLRVLRERQWKFLGVPHTYYEAVPTRVPNVKEDLRLLEDLQILLDGDDTGYLLQIFTQEVMGPFFFEFIQRKGNRGFGEGNFRALFEAIERDQVRRGTL